MEHSSKYFGILSVAADISIDLSIYPSPATPTLPSYSAYPTRSPACHDYYISSPSPIPQESQPHSQPSAFCIDPSSTQTRHQHPVAVVEQSSTPTNPSPPFKAESASVLPISPSASSSVDDTSLKHESCIDSNPVLSSDPFFPMASSNVVYPPKDACRK